MNIRQAMKMAWKSIWGKKGYTTEYRRILWEFLRHCEEKGWTDVYNKIVG